MAAVRLTVFGNPAPQGSKKFMGRTTTGRGIIVDSSDNTKPWRADVKYAAERWMERNPDFIPFSCGVRAAMVFTFSRPPSVRRNKRPFPSVFPDLSKLARSTEDALSASGLWKDDALVVEYTRLAKVYAAEDSEALYRPGCQIWVAEKPAPVIPLGDVEQRVLELEAARAVVSQILEIEA